MIITPQDIEVESLRSLGAPATLTAGSISAGHAEATLTINTAALEAAGRAISAIGELTIQSTLPVLLEAQESTLESALAFRDAQIAVLFDRLHEQDRRRESLESYIDRALTHRDARMDAHVDMINLQRKALAQMTGRLDLYEANEKAALARLELIDHTVRGMIDNSADHNEEQARRVSHLGKLVADLRMLVIDNTSTIEGLDYHLGRTRQETEALSSVAAHSARVVNMLAQQLDEAKGNIGDLAGLCLEGAERHMSLTDLVRALNGKLSADYEFVCERLADHAKQLAELEAVEDRQDEALTEVGARVDDLEAGPAPTEPPPPFEGTITWDSTWTVEEGTVLITAEPSPNVWYHLPEGYVYIFEQPSTGTLTIEGDGISIGYDLAEPGSDMTAWTAAELVDERVAHYTLGYYKGRDPRVQVVDCCDHPGVCCKCQGAPQCAYLDPEVEIIFEGDGVTRRIHGFRKPDGTIEFPGF